LGRMRCLHCTINKRNAFAHIKSDFVFAYEIRFCIQTRMHLYILSVVLHTYTKKILYIYIHIYIYIFMRVYIYCVYVCVHKYDRKKFVICIHYCRFNMKYGSYTFLLYSNWQDTVCYRLNLYIARLSRFS